MTTFRQKLEVIRGLPVNLPNGGSGRVMATYWETETCLVRVNKGEGYDLDFGHMLMSFVSDGTDQIVLPISELERVNR